MKTVAMLVLTLALAAPAEAARWKGHSVIFADQSGGLLPVEKMAGEWSGVSRIWLRTVAKAEPCAPNDPVPVCLGHYGPTAWISDTGFVAQGGYLVGALIRVNLDNLSPTVTEAFLDFLVGHEMGNAAARLELVPHDAASIMSTTTANPAPDALDGANLNRAFGILH